MAETDNMAVMSLLNWTNVLTAFLVYWIVSRVLVIYKSYHEHPNIPRIYTIMPVMGGLFNVVRLLNGKRDDEKVWSRRGELYTSMGCDAIFWVPLLSGTPLLYVASPEFFRQTITRLDFTHPPESHNSQRYLGQNVVTAQGNDWKRHRKVTNPAFNETTYRKVWDVTGRVYREIVEHAKWMERTDGGGSTDVTDIDNYTRKLAAFVVSECSFGIRLSLDDTGVDKDGNWSIQRVVIQAAEWILAIGNLPMPILKLPFQPFPDILKTYAEFSKVMNKLLADRIKEKEIDPSLDEERNRRDIVGSLLAERGSDAESRLSDEEIIGNCFIMFFAGHETTAKTLATVLTLLAINPEIQQSVRHKIMAIVGDEDPRYEDFDSLFDVTACFYEALRMFPVAYLLIRQPAEDTVINVPSPVDESSTQSIAVPKDVPFIYDVVGLCHNPRTFPNPLKFDPGRWTPNMEHPGFSTGIRMCQGRKFATLEGVMFLSLFLRDWEVSVKLNEGETLKMARERYLRPVNGFTLGIKNAPLILKRTA